MSIPHPPRSLFGEMNRSSVWAAEVNESGFAGSRNLSLSPGQVVFLLQVSGESELDSCGSGIRLSAGHVGVIGTGESTCFLGGDSSADLLMVGMSVGILAGMLETFRPGLRREIRELILSRDRPNHASFSMPEMVLTRTLPAFREPPVSGPAISFWFESQIRELVALTCFPPAQETGEFFCSRQKRLAFDRVARAKTILQSRLDESIDLQGLAREIGCSPYYLSRTFSATTGMTISRYVRKLRIEAAAELLLSGRFNVGEVAVEVGYQSLSHFSKAFQQVKGCLPSKYEAA